MPISGRHAAYLIGLLENEQKEIQSLIDELRSGNAKLAASDAERRISGVTEPDAPPTKGRGGWPKGKKRTPKQAAKVKRSANKTYTASLHHIADILKKAGEPLTPFKIKEKLMERFNIQVTEEALATALKHGLKREVFCCPQQGEYAIPN